MGLDIGFFEKVTYIAPPGCPPSGAGKRGIYLRQADSFKARSDGLVDGLYQYGGERGSFRAGSYSGYSSWRKELFNIVASAKPEERRQGVGQPFFELINFSDCEGFIGPVTSKKLYLDFVNWEKKLGVKNSVIKVGEEDRPDAYFIEKYNDWKNAFKVASKGGVVIFT